MTVIIFDDSRSAEPGSLALRIGFDDRAELLAMPSKSRGTSGVTRDRRISTACS
jgi:hypothetical protein